MVLVVMQHSYLNVNEKLIPPLFAMLLWGITGMAAVAFVTISGVVYSYYLCIHREWNQVYKRYAARAAFLMLAAHLMINMASYHFYMTGNEDVLLFSSFWGYLLFSFPITDTIGICILVAPVFIICLRPMIRALTIVTMLVITSVVVTSVNPSNAYLVKEAVFGTLGKPMHFWWPLVPWLAIFLSGSFGGEYLARVQRKEIDIHILVKQIMRAGVALLIFCILLILGYKVLKTTYATEWSADVFLRVLYPRQTTALLPGYFAILLFLLTALIHRIDISGNYNRLFWVLSILGRTSLFTFVLQFVVVESIPALLGLKGTLGIGGFLILFALGSTTVWMLAYLYGRVRGWITESDYALCLNQANTFSVK